MDAKLNSLPAITDFEAAYIIAQYAHENGLRAATGKDFYLWITGMLDLLGLSNTAGLPQFMPAPGATLTATDEKQWTFLFPNDDGTAATYNKIISGTITVPGDSIAIAQFDGTDYNTVRFIKMPKGEDGTNGTDGASLLKEWSDTSEEYPYRVNIAVRDSSGFIYISLVENNTYPLTDETKWASAGYREKIGGSDNVFEVVDDQGNIFAYVDGKGFFRAKYQNNSIPRKAVEGLELILSALNATSNHQTQTDNILEI